MKNDKGGLLVTIYTDGGLSPISGQAYAYYCRSNRGVIKAAIFIKNHFDDIHQVEAYAVYKAISVTMSEWENTCRIIVNSDSMVVCNSINKKRKSQNKRYQKIINAIRSFNVKIELRHVRAHQKSTDVRAYLNNWCDRELNRIRKQFNGKGV